MCARCQQSITHSDFTAGCTVWPILSFVQVLRRVQILGFLFRFCTFTKLLTPRSFLSWTNKFAIMWQIKAAFIFCRHFYLAAEFSEFSAKAKAPGQSNTKFNMISLVAEVLVVAKYFTRPFCRCMLPILVVIFLNCRSFRVILWSSDGSTCSLVLPN